MSTPNANPSASSAPATSASSRPPASPSSAARSAASTSTPTRSSACSRGEIPIYEPGLAELVARNRERLHFSTDIADALEHARLLFVAVGTPPTYSGDADLQRRPRRRRRDAAVRPPRARHEVDRARSAPARRSSASSREQGKEGFRYVSCPEFLKEGSAVADFLNPDRVVVGDDGDWAGDAVVELYRPLLAEHGGGPASSCAPTSPAPRWSSSPPTPSWPRRSRSSTRSPTSARRPAPTSSRSRAGMGLDDRIGPKFLQAGHRLRRLAASRRTSARSSSSPATRGYHFQLLNAVIEVNELQKRRVIGKLQKHLGVARRQARSRCSAWRSSRTPTTCARRRSLVLARAAAGRGRARRRATTRSPRTRRAS